MELNLYEIEYKKDLLFLNCPQCKQTPNFEFVKNDPDILIITGHDSMLKNGTNYSNVYNYRNSRYFVESVINARKWQNSSDNLVIFAGACQSFYEAIMEAGADFASSPGRILIDFIDPIIVAQKIATTDRRVYISAKEISNIILYMHYALNHP